MKKLKDLKVAEYIKDIPGDLIQNDAEIESLNEQYGAFYDGYILTPQNGRTTRAFLYGFNGTLTDETVGRRVTVFYR